MPKLIAREASMTGGVSLGVIIAVVIVGTVFLAVGGGLLCTWAARRKRHKRRQSRRQEEEEARKKQMMAVTMMRDSGEEGPAPGQAVAANGAGAGTDAAAAAATKYFRGAPDDCGSSTCCSLASSRDSFSTMDGDFEGSGVTWWWLWRWRRFWHNQRRWARRHQRSGGGSSAATKDGTQGTCTHDHGHNGHHHHRRGTVDGSPRKLRRRRPETSIIASTNSLFFSAFIGENDNNRDAIVNNAANGEIGLREPPPTFSIIRANSFPQRPPPPPEQQRLLPPHGSSLNGAPGPFSGGNRSSMPNMPPRPQNARYRPLPGPNGPPQNQPSLQPPPPISTRSLPRPPQPALIIPNQPETYIPPGVPFYPNMPPQQQHQMMIMMMQQQQMQLQQQIRQQHQQQQYQQQQQNQNQGQRLSRSGSKHAPQQNYTTEAALTEILRSTEQRLAQLQGTQPGNANLGSMKRASMTGPKTEAAQAAPTDDAESIKRISQTSGSDADSMVAGSRNAAGKDTGRDRDNSPILDAIPTALSSPSKSPNKNRVAAGTIAQAGSNAISGMGAHPMLLPAPPALSSLSNSSPETRSPSSVYSSSGASSRSSLSTVYSVDEQADEKEKTPAAKSMPTPKGVLAGLGITGTGATSDERKDADIQINHAVIPPTVDTTLVPAALATPKLRARGESISSASTCTTAAPDLPPRSPKRSAGSVTKGNGIMIPHSTSTSSLTNSNSMNTMNTMNNTMMNAGMNMNGNSVNRRHRRNGSVWQQAPSPQQIHQYGMGMNANNMMHNNSARFTFGGNSSPSKNNYNYNNYNSGNSSRPNSGHYGPPMMGPNAGVRLMVTSPSKPDTLAKDVSAPDFDDDKTPTSAVSITSPLSPSNAAWRKSQDRSLLLQSSPTLAPEDERSLVPGRANPRTSWGSWGGPPPQPPKHGRRSLNERIEALQAVESEADQFRRAVRPLPRPPSFGSLSNLNALNALASQMSINPRASYESQTSQASHSSSSNTGLVVAAAAELRRMNSTAYSEASSCYSNATSAIGKSPALGSSTYISTAPSAMGLTQQRRGGNSHRRRNSSGGESTTAAANRNSVVGSRQYLALGKKRVSQVPSHNGAYDKENRGMSKRSSAPPTASTSSGRPAPQRSRSARSMTTTGTALRRVDENPASGNTTPQGTPGKGTPVKGLTPSATAGSNLSITSSVTSDPATPKANTGRPLRKSPSRSTQVGNTLPTGSPVGRLRAKSMGPTPSTPPNARTRPVPTSRDSLGLYDQDGFLLSSPARKV